MPVPVPFAREKSNRPLSLKGKNSARSVKEREEPRRSTGIPSASSQPILLTPPPTPDIFLSRPAQWPHQTVSGSMPTPTNNGNKAHVGSSGQQRTAARRPVSRSRSKKYQSKSALESSVILVIDAPHRAGSPPTFRCHRSSPRGAILPKTGRITLDCRVHAANHPNAASKFITNPTAFEPTFCAHPSDPNLQQRLGATSADSDRARVDRMARRESCSLPRDRYGWCV
jgi:hypothetical protein